MYIFGLFYCNTKYNGDLYLDNIFAAFNFSGKEMSQIIQIVGGYILTIFLRGIYNLLINITIHKYTVCHSLILIGNQEIINLVSRFLRKKFEIYNIVYFCIIIFCYLIFLEFIELYCCGISENSKKNIKKRADEESSMLDEENRINNSSFKTDKEYNENNEENDNENNEIKSEENDI